MTSTIYEALAHTGNPAFAQNVVLQWPVMSWHQAPAGSIVGYCTGGSSQSLGPEDGSTPTQLHISEASACCW